MKKQTTIYMEVEAEQKNLMIPIINVYEDEQTQKPNITFKKEE